MVMLAIYLIARKHLSTREWAACLLLREARGEAGCFLFFFLSFDNLYAHGYAFMVSLMRLAN